jgi:hypothetical protein
MAKRTEQCLEVIRSGKSYYDMNTPSTEQPFRRSEERLANPPKVVTYYLSIVLAILGIILWVLGFLGFFAAFPLELTGFVLLLIAWLVLTVAVFIKGL